MELLFWLASFEELKTEEEKFVICSREDKKKIKLIETRKERNYSVILLYNCKTWVRCNCKWSTLRNKFNNFFFFLFINKINVPAQLVHFQEDKIPLYLCKKYNEIKVLIIRWFKNWEKFHEWILYSRFYL